MCRVEAAEASGSCRGCVLKLAVKSAECKQQGEEVPRSAAGRGRERERVERDFTVLGNNFHHGGVGLFYRSSSDEHKSRGVLGALR